MSRNKYCFLLGFTVALVAFLVFALVVPSRADTDITSQVQLVKSVLNYDRLTKTSYLDVGVKNTGQQVLLSPITVVVDSVSPSTVQVSNADGVTLDGKPYFQYTTSTGTLAPGESISSKRWKFSNPNTAKFSYSTHSVAAIPEAAGSIGPAGGSLQVTDPNSRLLGLMVEVPPAALDQNKLLVVKQVLSPPALPDQFYPADQNKLSVSSQAPSAPVLPERLYPAGPAIDLSPTGTAFQSDVRITIPYNDKDHDGIVDYTGLPPSNIKVMVYDESLQAWSEIPVSGIDTVNNTVSFYTGHFSVYMPASPAIPSGKNVFIFTIPGLDLINTALGEVQLASNDIEDDYLQYGILQMDLGLNLS